MAFIKNPEHFNVHGDKTVEVTVKLVIDVGEKSDDKVIMRNAAVYLQGLANRNEHSSWGRSVEIKE